MRAGDNTISGSGNRNVLLDGAGSGAHTALMIQVTAGTTLSTQNILLD